MPTNTNIQNEGLTLVSLVSNEETKGYIPTNCLNSDNITTANNKFSEKINSQSNSDNVAIADYKKIISNGQFDNRSETTIINSTALYKSPNTSSTKLLKLNKETKLIFIYESSTPKNWALVGTANGTLGYVPANDVFILMGGTTQI